VPDLFSILFKLVQERNSGGDVQLDHLLLRQLVKVHHQRAQAVAVCGDEHILPLCKAWGDLHFPVRQHPCGGIFQALAVWGLDVIAPAPELDLGVSVLLCGLGLVQPLKIAVVPFVQRLIEVRRDPGLPDDFQHDAERVVCPLQDRRECTIKPVSLQFLAGLPRFLDAFL